jgi:hypothetical protein
MTQEVRCNGAGEMPGHEGEGSYDDKYEGWLDRHEDTIVEKYRESIEDIDDVPQSFIDAEYERSYDG